MRRFLFGLFIGLLLAFSGLFYFDVRAVQSTDTSATRTAIAITHEPLLGTQVTPNSVDLTAVAAYALYEDKVATSWHQSGDQLNMTASAIVGQATRMALELTQTPLFTSTPAATETPMPCVLYFNENPDELTTNQIIHALNGLTLQGAVGVYNLELTMPYNCPAEVHFLRTEVTINSKINHLNDDSVLIYAVEELLAHLQNTQLTGDGRSLRLILEFSDYDPVEYCQFRRIDTGFTNARLAYKQGLRGEKLIEALGGILNTNQDLLGLCPLTSQ